MIRYGLDLLNVIMSVYNIFEYLKVVNSFSSFLMPQIKEHNFFCSGGAIVYRVSIGKVDERSENIRIAYHVLAGRHSSPLL